MINAHHKREGDKIIHGFGQKTFNVVIFVHVHSIRAICIPDEGLAALLNESTFAVVFDITIYDLELKTEWLRDLKTECMPKCGLEPSQWPNNCNVNLYNHGKMAVGWHADDEPLFGNTTANCSIISISFGTLRRFELQLNADSDGLYKKRGYFSFDLQRGDVMNMEGRT